MLTGMELMSCQNLAVPVEVMHHVVDVESGYNPYAIGVVGGQLVRQPQNLDEALATVQMLESKGYNFSVGVAQVNRANLARYGLDSYNKAFDPCQNLAVGSRILNACYYSSGGDWGKAFSCYYSGNFVTGFRDGYVQKIYDSFNRTVNIASSNNVTAAIPLQVVGIATQTTAHGARNVPVAADNAAYRVAIRSMLIDTAATAITVPAVNALLPTQAAPTGPTPATVSQAAVVSAPTQAAGAQKATASADPDIFVPEVHGPNDPPPQPKAATASVAATQQTAATVQMAGTAPAAPPVDRADMRQGGQDNAFVF